MENDPRRRRPRGRRSPRDAQRPTRPPAQPRPPGIRGPARDPGPPRAGRRGEAPRAAAAGGTERDPRDGRGARGGRAQRSRQRPQNGQGDQGGSRGSADLRAGTACLIVLDCRDGEPDRSGAAAVFEGFFDFETGEPRRPGVGIPRLRVVPPAALPVETLPAHDLGVAPVPAPARQAPPAVERLWGFECWWRPDPARTGLTAEDHQDLEASKRLLRGLLRDTRRAGRSLQPR